MQSDVFTDRERRLIVSELRGAARDGIAITQSVFGALSFISLTSLQFSLPPLAWVTTYWTQICKTFWTFALSWLPFEIELSELTTNGVTLFLIVGVMFIRGRRAGYVGLNAFSIRAQDYLARMLYYGLVLFVFLRIRVAAPVALEAFAGRWALVALAALTLIGSGYGIFRLYVRTLRRLHVVPALIARPWVILLGPVLVLFFNAALPSSNLGNTPPDDLGLLIAGVFIFLLQLFLGMLAFFFGTPLACWYPRVAGSMAVAVVSLLALDGLWLAIKGASETTPTATIEAARAADPVAGVDVRSEHLTPEDVKAELVSWIEALESGGTRGAIAHVEACYATAEREATLRALDRCLALELFAKRAYEVKARYHGVLTDAGMEFFSADQITPRMARACLLFRVELDSCPQRALDIGERFEPHFRDVILQRI